MVDLTYLVKNKKGLLIDIDNTIINYSYSHEISLKHVLNKYDFTNNDYENAKSEVKKWVKGVNCHKKELYFKKMIENKKMDYDLLKYMTIDYENKFLDNMLVDSSIKRLLKYCKENNIKTCAVSNFYNIYQINKLKRANVLSFFDYIITSEDLDIEKPNNIIFEYALEKMNISHNDIIMIGDSTDDDCRSLGIDFYLYNCNNIFISIVGKSGAGKTTISKILKYLFNASVLHGDSYHKYERNDIRWKSITHYNIDANNIDILEKDVKSLYYTKDIMVSEYNHTTGTFEKSKTFKYNNNLVVEGLHNLYNTNILKYFKFKIFLENINSDNLKIKRDVKERNKKVTDVVDSILTREDDYKKYIECQKKNANILITVYNDKIKILFSKKELLKMESIFINNNIYYFDSDEYIQYNSKYDGLEDFKNIIHKIFVLLKDGIYE